MALHGLGALVVHYKEQFLVIIAKYFAKDDYIVENVERKCIKISLRLKNVYKLQKLLHDIENQQLHRNICSLIKNTDFDGLQIILPPEHLSIYLETVNGEPINYSNYRLIVTPGECDGMTFL